MDSAFSESLGLSSFSFAAAVAGAELGPSFPSLFLASFPLQSNQHVDDVMTFRVGPGPLLPWSHTLSPPPLTQHTLLILTFRAWKP